MRELRALEESEKVYLRAFELGVAFPACHIPVDRLVLARPSENKKVISTKKKNIFEVERA